MKKKFKSLVALLLCTVLLAACGSTTETPQDTPAAPAPAPQVTAPDAPPETPAGVFDELGLDENRRFYEQRSIRVLAWARDNDPTKTIFADYLKERMLEEHNVVVEFVTTERWNEVDDLTLLLAEGQAPDVCYTFNYPTIEAFANQDVITDLNPLLADSGDLYPNLWERLGWMRLYWNQDSTTGHVWSMLGMQPFNQRFISFIREDWLNALGMALPTTLEEFEAALYAFKDNAELLLGSDAGQIVPLHMTDDPGWLAGPLIESFIPNDITDKELYISGTGDPGASNARKFFAPGVKEAIRVLNKWYNDGLIHPDFALFSQTDDTADNFVRSGFVGAIAGHSFDQPYRDGEEGWTGRMHAARGTDANFIAVNTFKNDAGLYRKYLGATIDRNMFIPATSTEPIAALLYLDLLCRQDVITFLQMGTEGINHEVMPDGAMMALSVEAGDYNQMTSGRNYDLSIPINGLDLGDPDLTSKSAALGYAGVEGRLIQQAYAVQAVDNRVTGNVGTPSVQSEEGLGDTIRERGNAAFCRAIFASVDQFDAVYDSEMESLYTQFVNASRDERLMLWESVHGSADMLPQGD
ncbi:MAG: extracellular solute-binding protein [Lachnospiraceae bacterium]|nr:extracellular solute-binding protein [Lachnospiraceae bacterium]